MGLTNNPALREAYRTAAMRNADLLRQELTYTEGLRSSVVVEEGPVEAVILAVAAREQAELIVTGIGRTSPLAQVLIGSTATALARTSPVPLLVVKKKVLLTSFSLGQFLLGTAIAAGVSRAMVPLQPSKPTLRRWQRIPRLVGIVTLDILRSNAAVASIILQGNRRNRLPGFVVIPLQLRDKTGLAVLACIITSTPGTAWIEYAPDTGFLLIHVLDLVDEEEWVGLIKTRYEAPLMEIFE